MNYDQETLSLDRDTSACLNIPMNLPIQINSESCAKTDSYRRPSLLKSNALDVEDCKIHFLCMIKN